MPKTQRNKESETNRPTKDNQVEGIRKCFCLKLWEHKMNMNLHKKNGYAHVLSVRTEKCLCRLCLILSQCSVTNTFALHYDFAYGCFYTVRAFHCLSAWREASRGRFLACLSFSFQGSRELPRTVCSLLPSLFVAALPIWSSDFLLATSRTSRSTWYLTSACVRVVCASRSAPVENLLVHLCMWLLPFHVRKFFH